MSSKQGKARLCSSLDNIGDEKSSSSFAIDEVVVHVPTKSHYAKQSRSNQYKTKHELRCKVNSLFEDYAMDTVDERKDFLRSMERDILLTARK